MKKVIPIEKNMDYIIDINGFGYEGEGVGKIEDFTIFVQGALKGEKVKVKIVKVNKNFAFGKLLEIIEPSKDRVEAPCSIYKMCGGCQLQHLSYEGQLQFKKQRVRDCLTRIGKLNIIDDNEKTLEADNDKNTENIKHKAAILHNTLGMENPWRYRNKVQLPVGEENGEIKIGFYAERSHKIINLDTCLIQGEIADKVVELTKKWAEKHTIKPYDEEKSMGTLRHVMVREAFKTGEVMIVLVTNGRELKAKDEFIKLMVDNIKGLTSIVQNINTKKTNVILGQECITLWGKDYITDYISQFRFNISPLSFFQVNPVQTEVLYSKALEYAGLTGDEVVFDAYCGAGTISLFLSQKAKKVYGVEIIPEAIENAVQNAKENGVDNAEFIVGESERVIPELISKGIKADVVVVDPPRKGCDKVLLEAIAKMQPQRVVYVSCDPGTLARDLGILDELGYETLEVQPVDMFSATAHVETCVLLYHKNPQTSPPSL